MNRTFAIVFAVPLVGMSIALWMIHTSKIKPTWFGAAIAYFVAYSAIFQLWLNQF